MSLWRYQYFVDVVDTKSFTKAGKKNYVSQTAISQQIAQLEKSMGGKLVRRERGQIMATQLGEIVYSRAKEILEINEQLLAEVEAMKTQSILRVGVDNSINRAFWGEIQNILDSYYEEEDFRFAKLDYETGSMMLEHGELDIYIGYDLNTLEDNPSIEEALLGRSRVGVYTSDRFETSKKREFTYEDLQGHPGYATKQYPCGINILKWGCIPEEICKNITYIGNLDTLSIKVDMNDGFAFADSNFFSFYTGNMHLIKGLEESVDLKLFYRTDKEEQKERLKDFIAKIQDAVAEMTFEHLVYQ